MPHLEPVVMELEQRVRTLERRITTMASKEDLDAGLAKIQTDLTAIAAMVQTLKQQIGTTAIPDEAVATLAQLDAAAQAILNPPAPAPSPAVVSPGGNSAT